MENKNRRTGSEWKGIEEKEIFKKYKKLVPFRSEYSYGKYCQWKNTYEDYLWILYTEFLNYLKLYKVSNIHKLKFEDFVQFSYHTSSKTISNYA